MRYFISTGKYTLPVIPPDPSAVMTITSSSIQPLDDTASSLTSRLKRSRAELAPATLETGQILLRKHIMDQQVVDCRGLKLQRVNDIAMGFSDGALHLWGMDTGIRGFLTRLDYGWGFLGLLRPL